jgi:hypothetical protein
MHMTVLRQLDLSATPLPVPSGPSRVMYALQCTCCACMANLSERETF